MKFKAACIQINPAKDIDENIAKTIVLLTKAAKDGADLLLLPENMAGRNLSNAEKFLSAMQELVPHLKLSILIGSLVAKANDPKKFRNRSYFIAENGAITAQYDKIHLFDSLLPNGEKYNESNYIEPGDKAVIAETPFGKIGLTVCYDLRFPHLFRELAKKGAEIITVPSAFTKYTGELHWHTLLRARAIENGCYILAPGQTGARPDGKETYGHSLIVAPSGKIIAEAGLEEGFISAEIDLDEVEKARGTIPSLKHDREFSV